MNDPANISPGDQPTALLNGTAGKWFFSFLLSLPVLLYFISYFFNHSNEIIPTGFIQYDNVAYAGNARQYTDPGHVSIFYQNRLNDSGGYPQVYFQPQQLILALYMRLGFPPGMSLCLFTSILTVFFFRLLISFFDFIYPSVKHRTLLLILFSWGGGVLTLCGWLLYAAGKTGGSDFAHSGLFLDPASGWWGLNLGRSLLFSMEVFYHILFFAGIFLVMKKKWLATVIICALLSLSHPFTGIELLLIMGFWAITENLLFRSKIPILFMLAIGVIFIFHFWYYLFFLNRFPEHESVFTQYQLNWRLRFFQLVPAYAIVALFAWLSLRRIRSIKTFFSAGKKRLMICWLLMALLLANHELFMRPMQPLHFTRGYIWSALFLIAVPGLDEFISRLKEIAYGRVLTAFMISLFLFDNLFWFYENTRYTSVASSVTYIDEEQERILQYLRSSTSKQTLIIGSDATLPYLATVYTNAYSWISHPYNTPFYERKWNVYEEYIQTGHIPEAWRNRSLIIIADKRKSAEMKRFESGRLNSTVLYNTAQHILYRPFIK